MSPPSGPDRLDVDVRFVLANERTLLAWVRTGLALQAGGVALVQLVGDRPALIAVGVGLILLGTVAVIVGYVRYRAAGRAIRAGRLPPAGRGPVVVTAGVVVLAGLLLGAYAAQLASGPG